MLSSPYTDLERPPLGEAALRRALVVPGGVWTSLRLHAETGSTNEDAAAAARAGAPEGLVVVAERQTAGRGRCGRAWESPARGGLAVSVLLRPTGTDVQREWAGVPAARFGWLPLLAGVAVVAAVAARAEVADAALKWPNDLLVGARKCGGILAETVPGGPGDDPAVVVGIGVNVTLRTGELPDERATSLLLAGAAHTDRDPLLRAVLRNLAGWYERWRDAGGDAAACGLRAAYLDACATIGHEVRVALPGPAYLTGTATTVDGDGRLVVTLPDGTVQTVAAGDVVHLRPESDPCA
ncbi:MAG TPA: biotin--[acetyl-CoA-carboxylase] ligase [Micromonosporaceae bacterium]|nr:biotin--[acetyl-CoA-carboxylase] ligase [Micromonosporaceae bacterium]